MANKPLVAAVLHAGQKNQRYHLYSAAYGLEMQINNNWQAELILLAPHEYLYAVTKETSVTGKDTAIVSAGVTDIPLSHGGPDLSVIQHERNNWLLVAGTGNSDSEETIAAKLRTALRGGCRVILCFADVATDQLANRLAAVQADQLSQLVIAYIGPDATSPSVAESAGRFTHNMLQSTFSKDASCPFIVGGQATAAGITALISIPTIAGVLLQEKDYGDFGDILELLEAIAKSFRHSGA